MNEFFWPLFDEYDLDQMWFQPAGAAWHTTRENMALLSEQFYNREIFRLGEANWPPRTWVLTPLLFSLWDNAKDHVYADKP